MWINNVDEKYCLEEHSVLHFLVMVSTFEATYLFNTVSLLLHAKCMTRVGLAVDEQFRDIRICLIHPSGHSDIWISSGYQNLGQILQGEPSGLRPGFG